MEVNRVTKSTLSRVSLKEEKATDSISFQSVMSNKKTEQTIERLQAKLKDLEMVGEKLVESRTVDNLRKYKKMVKDFLDDAVKNGLELQEQRGFNFRGSAKTYKIVKEVDKKLIDLTNAVMDKESQGLDILNLVGEIKGMLINIYT